MRIRLRLCRRIILLLLLLLLLLRIGDRRCTRITPRRPQILLLRLMSLQM